MTDYSQYADMPPEVVTALRQAEELQDLLETQRRKMETDKFTAADETNTVEVTIDGRHALNNVYIDEEITRLGPDVIEQRLNQAIQKAETIATESAQEDREKLEEGLARINAQLDTIKDPTAHQPE